MSITRINKTPEEIQEELRILRAKLDAMPSRNKNRVPLEPQEETTPELDDTGPGV